MKIAILGGGGAMGGLFGGLLSDSGQDVVLVDVSTVAVDAISERGLVIEERNDLRTLSVKATTDPASVGPVDLVINFVKCYHTESAVRSALVMMGPDTAVLSLQNGWGNAGRIAAIAGERRVLVGLTYHAATLIAPGHVKHPAAGKTVVGELDGSHSTRLKAITAALESAGIEAAASNRILDEVWKKLALNASTLPIAALLRFFANQLAEHDGTKALARGLLDEVVAVAKPQGIAIDVDERWQAISDILARAIGGKGSMLQDVEAKRRTEIEVINGAVVDVPIASLRSRASRLRLAP